MSVGSVPQGVASERPARPGGRARPVSDSEAPFVFTGARRRVSVMRDDDQALDAEGAACAVRARA